MADRISKEQRSWNMSRIRGRNTRPEMIVRSMLHRMGFRFRLNRKDLPGKPDIVLPRHKTVIFVHGCFWHRHPKCKYSYTPKSRLEFWIPKFNKNIEADKKAVKGLEKLGWNVIVFWECELAETENLEKKISVLLSQ